MQIPSSVDSEGFPEDESPWSRPPPALPYPITAPLPPPNLLFGTELLEESDMGMADDDIFSHDPYVLEFF
jgi:hypothetical protein